MEGPGQSRAVSMDELPTVCYQWLPSCCSQELVFTLRKCCCSQYPDKGLGGHYEVDMVGPEVRGQGANPTFMVRADSTCLLIDTLYIAVDQGCHDECFVILLA